MSTDMSGIYSSFPKNLTSINVPLDLKSKFITLSENIPWEDFAKMANEERAKNVNIKNGRPLNLRLHLGAYIAQQTEGWTDRTTEDMIQHHAGVRVLCGVEELQTTIDHTNILRFRNQLGPSGAEKMNHLLVQFAEIKGFTGSDICSSDTTVQEAPIAHPTEVGHLKNIGEALLKIGKKIKKGILEKLSGLKQEAMAIFTEIRLFTRGTKEKTIEKKKSLSLKLHKVVTDMLKIVEGSMEKMSAKSKEKYLSEMTLFQKMTAQIKVWIKTGQHPSGKIISLWLETARAISREKVSRSTEFGRRWIITRLMNGYTIGGPCQKLGGDSDQNIAGEVMTQFLNCFGEVPKYFIYDRGGDGPSNHEFLEDIGVKNILIFRKGKEKMEAGKITYNLAKRERALSEASIAILKNGKYDFNKPRAKSAESSVTKGHLAIFGANLTKISRDLLLKKAS